MEEKSPKKSKKKSSTNWMLTIGLSLMLTAAVFLVWFFLNGKTTVTGGWPDDKSSSLNCEAGEIAYPIFKQDEMRGNIKINVIFSNDEPSTMSLLYKTKFENDDDRTNGRVSARGALEESFASSGLSIDALNATYSSLDDNVFQMSLYASGVDLNNGNVYKFFMLDGNSYKGYTLESMQKSYVKSGFTCVANQ